MMNGHNLYDVAIVGGGLAGLCLAIQCAEQNYKVVLFEKEVYPFHKVCGEYISLESRDFLQRHGFRFDDFDLPIIKTLRVSDVKGKCCTFPLPLGGFGVSRFLLDNELYKIALSKGVEVHVNSKVNSVGFDHNCFTITTNETTVQSKVAAGAFGKRSNIDVKWKRPFVMQKTNSLNNYIGIKYHVQYDHKPGEIALHNFDNGYCGLSKIEEGKSCLCYLTTAENLKSYGNSIDEMQQKVLYKNPQLKEIFTGAKFLYDQPLAISQVSFSKKTQVQDHVLLPGDAAGMISPLCGNGMSMAMHGSKLAFEISTQFLSGKISREDMEQQYSYNWKKEFSGRLQMGRTVQRFFGGNTSTSFFLRLMDSLPFISNQVIKTTHGTSF